MSSHLICAASLCWQSDKLDYKKIYDSMLKPAFLFDGRNLVNHQEMRDIGFVTFGIGKPLGKFVTESS